MNDKNFIEELRQKREEYGVTQTRLAVACGISREYYNRIEKGKQPLNDELREVIEKQIERFNPQEPLFLLIDYFRVRFPTTDALAIIRDVLQLKSDYMLYEDYGKYGYESKYVLGDINIMCSMQEHLGVLLELKGKGCRQMECYLLAQERSWYDFMLDCMTAGGVMKRLDLAINDRAGILDIPKLKEKYKAGECVSYFRMQKDYSGTEKCGSDLPKNTGETLYLGSTSSEYKEYRPLIAPMYYDYPENEQAYPVRELSFVEGVSNNQYLFGTDMMVAPITSDQIDILNQGKVKVWIPEGCYHDFFTGLIYKGEKVLWMFRDLNSIPVLVKAGAIIPMQKELFGKDFLKNPDELIIRVYGGEDGHYTHYEDDGETEDYRDGINCCFTEMRFDWENGIFTIEGAKGQKDLIPEKRAYTIDLCGVKESVPKLYAGGKEVEVKYEYEPKMGCVRIHIPKVSVDEKLEVVFGQKLALNDNHTLERVYDLLNQAQGSNLAKESAYQLLRSGKNLADILGELETTNLDKEIGQAVIEIMTADM